MKVPLLEDGLVGWQFNVLEGGEQVGFLVDVLLVVLLLVEELERPAGVLQGDMALPIHRPYYLFLYATVMILGLSYIYFINKTYYLSAIYFNSPLFLF